MVKWFSEFEKDCLDWISFAVEILRIPDAWTIKLCGDEIGSDSTWIAMSFSCYVFILILNILVSPKKVARHYDQPPGSIIQHSSESVMNNYFN